MRRNNMAREDTLLLLTGRSYKRKWQEVNREERCEGRLYSEECSQVITEEEDEEKVSTGRIRPMKKGRRTSER